MAKLRVEGHNSLIRDTVSNAVVNSSTSEYKIVREKRKGSKMHTYSKRKTFYLH